MGLSSMVGKVRRRTVEGGEGDENPISEKSNCRPVSSTPGNNTPRNIFILS